MNKCHFYIHSKTISDGYECFFLEIVTTIFKIHAYHAIDFKVAMEESWFYPTLIEQIIIIPKPELRGFCGDSLTKPPFGVTNRRERSL